MEDLNLSEEISKLAMDSQKTPVSTVPTESQKPEVLSRATGRRKTTVAQVEFTLGDGQITINGKQGEPYFKKNADYIGCVKAPLNLLKVETKYNFIIQTKGGGLLEKSEAIQLGISRALCNVAEGDCYRHKLKKKDFFLSSLGTGRRKTAVAQVKLVEGSGEITINGKKDVVYLQKNAYYINRVKAPLILLNVEKNYDFIIKVKGGGILGQAEAIQLGISRALCDIEQDHRSKLKQNGFLIRNSRVKERKKYGLKKARKAPQYSKR